MRDSADTRSNSLVHTLRAKDMKPKDAVLRQDSPAEELPEVVAMIRPLPENVVPSERFLEQMRIHLLHLQQAKVPASKRAA